MDGDSAELLSLKAELEEVISLTESTIAELKAASAQAQARPSSQHAPPSTKEKWSRENHPAFQAGYRKAAEADEAHTSPAFSVNDTVLARWVSGDNSFYPARITSITGSSTSPVYIVTFKSYATTETLSAKDIKHVSGESKKRKADASPTIPATPVASALPTNVGVISAAASIDAALADQARKEPSKVSDGPARPAKLPRKVKANKELEAGKSKWQDFTTKGKIGKVAQKDSMFRTPDGVNGRGERPGSADCIAR